MSGIPWEKNVKRNEATSPYSELPKPMSVNQVHELVARKNGITPERLQEFFAAQERGENPRIEDYK